MKKVSKKEKVCKKTRNDESSEKKKKKNLENEHVTPGELCCVSYSCSFFLPAVFILISSLVATNN